VHPGISQRAGANAGARWTSPAEIVDGADQRSRLTVEHILPDSNVMNLGTGMRQLATVLPPTGKI